jgi:uroporphyrin-III C-methyltransferase/precorrin-2 dehydrogenase/sirohydrochlorin ferrochelatase
VVIDATGDPDVAQLLINAKSQRELLLNIVDQPGLCDFYFAALVQKGLLKVAVSSSGASPTIARVVRDRIGAMLPKSLTELTQAKAAERSFGLIDRKAARREALRAFGTVYLVGCGTGDVELLSIKAYRIIQKADVVLVDHLISDEIREIIPETTLTIDVGKQKGAHKVSQEKINELLLGYAAKGLCVARLKSGDPYVFGRGAEEAQVLTDAGIKTVIIPGVSSAIAGASSAGIPVTARGYAANFSVVSAHLSGSRTNTDWLPLLQIPNHTTVVLMGLSRTQAICDLALQAGVAPDMPVAIVSNATRPGQQTHITTLSSLPETAKKAVSPAILVFGDVVKLSGKLPHYINETITEASHECIS